MPRKNLRFTNDAGDALAAILDTPDIAPVAYALFAHCFTCSKNLKAANHLSRALCDAGIAVLRFDFTGLGQSEGDFADTSFSSNVQDLIAAARFMEKEYAAPHLLIGHSLGGTAVLRAAGDIPSAVAVATIGSPATPSHVGHLFGDSRAAIERDGEACVTLGGREFRVKKSFIDDLEDHPMPESIASLRKALLIMHAPLDDTVEVENAGALFAHAKHPKSFVSLDKADHLLSRETDSQYAGRVLAAWASRFLPDPDVAQETQTEDSGPDEVVATTPAGGFRTELAVAGHAMIADEPVAYGGTNLGPTPYDYLGAALASCTTMTLQMYARHKNLDLQSANVRVRHQKVHAKDCTDCETESGKIDEFRRVLELTGDLSDAQRQRMLEIADRCPVHRTLHSEVKVRTELA